MANKHEYTPELLEEYTNKYFMEIDSYNEKLDKVAGKLKIPSIYDLASFLDVDSETLVNYSHKQQFIGTIKKAKDRIISFYAKYSCNRHIDTTMSIFLMKNLGLTDKQEIKQDTTSSNTNYNYDFSNKSDDEIKKLLEAANNGEDIDL